MSSFGQVPINKIWEMLDECAPGYTRKKCDHHWRVSYKGKVFPSLPLGEHGARRVAPIQVMHVRQMARALGITPCAKGYVPKIAG